MKKKITRIITSLILLVMLIPSTAALADAGYTYNYDFWEEVQQSPDAYSVKATLTNIELGIEKKMSNASSLFVRDNMIYVCDSGNNRIIQLKFENDVYTVERIIEEISGSEVTTFNNPTDIFVAKDGHIFIADQNNSRILKLDNELNTVLEFVKPVDDNFEAGVTFLPQKIVVDDAGRVYAIVSHVNKGIVKYEPDGEFVGFIGATPVKYSWYEYIWKEYLMTKAQRAQTENFVPTEYDNISLDEKGFMYVVTTNFDEAELMTDSALPIRKLNSLGNDILIKNGNFPPVGDIDWDNAGGYTGSSKLIDITVMDNDTYFAVDKTRGRIFGYDDQGHLLYAFGGNGNKDGYFRNPTSIEHMGKDLLVLDSIDGQITVFTPTEFGSMIFNALDAYDSGDYDLSADIWQKVLMFNGNYDLAYIGIGRAKLRQGQYKEAMHYFETKYDDDNYAKAFQLYRKEWVEDHIGIIFVVFFLVLLIPLGIGRLKRVRKEVEKYEYEMETVFKRKR
ncbi:MAG: hypothetical protein MJ131_05035 [Lachnospiraceae bacterium]|nr:hypothetical protein [Lachnospiraceae bacterium]